MHLASAPFARRPSLGVLIAITGIGPLALNIFIPSMPGLQRVFATDYATVQLTLSLYLVGVAVAQLFYGPLSDRYGRRPVLLAGMTLCLFGSIACLLAPTVEALIAGRVLQAVGACSGLVLSRAIIRDLYDRAEAASRMGYVMMAMIVAPMIAPTIGGILDVRFGWQASFIFLVVIVAVVLAAAAVFLHETFPGTGAVQRPSDMVVAFARLLRVRAFNRYAWQGAFSSAVFFSFLGGAPYVTMEILGHTPEEYGFLFASLSLMYMLGNFMSGRFSVRIGSDRMIWYGVVLGVVGTSLLSAVAMTGRISAPLLFGAMSIVSVGNGLSLPNGMAGAVSVDPRLAGAASGLAGFLQMGVGASASFLVATLLDRSATPLVLMMLTGAIGALAVHALLRVPPGGTPTERRDPAGEPGRT